MSDTNVPIPNHEPSPPTIRVEKDGYEASFYGGFVSRLAVRSGDTVTELYNQEEIFYLPPGRDKPWSCSTLNFAGPDDERFQLQINDPNQQIDRIEIHLKGPQSQGARRELVERLVGIVQGYQDDPPPPADPSLVVILEDGPVLCPPACPIV